MDLLAPPATCHHPAEPDHDRPSVVKLDVQLQVSERNPLSQECSMCAKPCVKSLSDGCNMVQQGALAGFRFWRPRRYQTFLHLVSPTHRSELATGHRPPAVSTGWLTNPVNMAELNLRDCVT